jgi:hypothetical protein
MVCEYNSNVLTALSLAINLVRPGEDFKEDGDGTTMSVRTRNVSQSVACRVVGMIWVINAALYLLLSCGLVLHGNIRLGHVTNCKYIIRYCNG